MISKAGNFRSRLLDLLGDSAKSLSERHPSEHSAKVALLLNLVNNLPGLACIYDHYPDDRRELVFLGQGLAQIVGEQTAKQLDVDVSIFFELIHPDDVDALQDAADAAVAADSQFDHEYRISTDWGYRWVRSFGSPAGQEDGVVRWTAVLLDIAMKKEFEMGIQASEEALIESEDSYRELVENLQDGIAVVDLNEKLTFANTAAERVFGTAEGGLLGCCLDEFTSKAGYEAVRIQSSRRIKGSRDTYELEIIRASGEKRHISVSASPKYNRQGAFIGTLGIFRDITEFKSLEQQFFQAQKMEAIGRLAGGIAHDFNNLLTAIVGSAEAGLYGVDADSPVHAHLTVVVDTAMRAAQLTRQLLAFSREQVIDPKLIRLDDSLLNMTKMLQRIIGDEIILKFIRNPRLGLAFVDPTQIEQIVVNLAVNAKDAMPSGGSLTIETANVQLDDSYASSHPESTPGSYVMLSATDSGHGMSDELMQKIFEPFFTTKDKSKGTGLGLSTVYGIVKQNGGHLDVESTAGKGTTFRIYFPREQEDEKEANQEEESEVPPKGTETVTAT